MPQLDLVTFLAQYVWLVLLFLTFYVIVLKRIIPGLTRIFRFRTTRFNPSVFETSQEETETLQRTRTEFISNLVRVVKQLVVSSAKTIDSRFSDSSRSRSRSTERVHFASKKANLSSYYAIAYGSRTELFDIARLTTSRPAEELLKRITELKYVLTRLSLKHAKREPLFKAVSESRSEETRAESKIRGDSFSSSGVSAIEEFLIGLREPTSKAIPTLFTESRVRSEALKAIATENVLSQNVLESRIKSSKPEAEKAEKLSTRKANQQTSQQLKAEKVSSVSSPASAQSSTELVETEKTADKADRLQAKRKNQPKKTAEKSGEISNKTLDEPTRTRTSKTHSKTGNVTPRKTTAKTSKPKTADKDKPKSS